LIKKIRTFSHDRVLVGEKRKQIIERSVHLFAKQGYDRTTTRDLSEVIGMSAGTLYHYVGSKEDIAYLILKDAKSEWAKAFERIRDEVKDFPPAQALEQAIRRYVEFLDDHQDIVNFINHVVVNLQKDDRKSVFESEKRSLAHFEELLRNGIEAGEFAVDNISFMAHKITILAQSWVNRRWYLRNNFTLEEYLKEMIKYILSNVKVDKHRIV